MVLSCIRAFGISSTRQSAIACGRAVLLAFLALAGAMQGTAQTWLKILGGASSDWIDSAAPAPDGGAYLGGSNETAGTGSDYDIWVARLDANGAIQWLRRLATDRTELHVTLKSSPDGGVFLLASSIVAGVTLDVVLAKLDPDGGLAWQVKQAGSTGTGQRPLMSTAEGGVIAAVYMLAPEARLMFELDANGTLVWSRKLGGQPSMMVLAEHADGGFFAAGRYWPVVGIRDRGWVARFDPTGNRLWERAIEFGMEFTSVTCLGSTPDGGAVLAGHSGIASDGRATLFTMRFDPDGALVRQQSYEWPEAQMLSGGLCDVLPDGGMLVGGRGRNDTTLDEDAWYARFVPDGTLAWQGTYFIGQGIGGRIDGVAALSDGTWLAASHSLTEPFGLADVAILRMDDTGYISYPCPELQPGGLVPDPKTAVIVPVTTADVPGSADPMPGDLTMTDETWQITDHCCPYHLPPAELSGPGSSQPLLLQRRFTRILWEAPPPPGSCAANLYRGDLRNLRAGGYGSCFAPFVETGVWGDSSRPPSGSGWFYLVTAVNLATEGPMGNDSLGAPRVNATPCP